MALVICEVHKGLGKRDAAVAIRDVHNIRTFLQVDRDFLTEENGAAYLPIGVVHKNKEKGVALIELPYEADSGVHRLWVPLSSLLEPSETPA